MSERGTLDLTEPHPASFNALEWIQTLPLDELLKWQSAFASCAIEGNRLAEVCSETLRRLLDQEPVSDRYLLGLAWSMRYGEAGETTGGSTEGQGEGEDEGEDQQ